MKISSILTLISIIALVFAIGFILAPAQSLGLIHVTTDVTGLWILRILGLTFLGYALLAWYAQDLIKRLSQKPAAWLASVVDLGATLISSFINKQEGRPKRTRRSRK